MSDKVDLSEYKGNYLLERYAFQQTTQAEWPALAHALGWSASSDPTWMTDAERREFWQHVYYVTPQAMGPCPVRQRITNAVGRLVGRR